MGDHQNSTETVRRQHPDLCAILDMWDRLAIGTGPAVKQGTLPDSITVITSSGGAASTCDLIRANTFDIIVNYDGPGMGRGAWSSIMITMQNAGGGNLKTQVFSPTYVMTKKNVEEASCWTLEKYASRFC